MSGIPTIIERAARAAVAEIERDGDCFIAGPTGDSLTPDDDLTEVVIDGRLNLRKVIRAAIDAYLAASDSVLMPRELDDAAYKRAAKITGLDEVSIRLAKAALVAEIDRRALTDGENN
ncbi:MAG TPA: hypothetical protein VNC39_01465 [Acidocella sp.]|jgi:hypothetical protein|uniref:hypothetical protein n=1 Tax=Acidocella sp. TaxID=50710 RepID=UPI002C9B7741|nr:hypothetical protein [Acidocella sp.]HVE20618.1 hypothetical protein [Acidocella sp.]